MNKPTIFIDVTTSLRWGANTAVGIVRVERYLIKTLLETYAGSLGLVVFDKEAGVFRSVNRDETNTLLTYLYAPPDAETHSKKETPLALMRRLNREQMAAHSRNYFDARIRGRLEAAGVPQAVTKASRFAFRTTIAAASVLVKLMPEAPPTQGAPPTSPDGIPERALATFESYRERRSIDQAWLVMAGLTWDYMHYAHLHKLKATGRVKIAHVVYDTIPVDFPQFVPHASHLYHAHFVEIAQTTELLYAISDYSADRFAKAILEPNLLEANLHAHGLPDFLTEHVDAPKPVPRLNGRRFVSFCSTIEARKNHGLLLSVWKRLLQSIPPEQVPILVLVGKWGWAFEAVKNQIELDPALERHVVVLSNVSDAELVWLYQNSVFTVFPSFSEGWGLAVSESLYHGTPVVMSTAPALAEAAQGLMPQFDPYDIVAWEKALAELIRSPEALASLRARAAEFKPIPVSAFADKLTGLLTA
jgi:glycosyltransferase involved in cell wall biosynthesis